MSEPVKPYTPADGKPPFGNYNSELDDDRMWATVLALAAAEKRVAELENGGLDVDETKTLSGWLEQARAEKLRVCEKNERLCEANASLAEERDRLRAAVEWALEAFMTCEEGLEYIAELRRRAGLNE